VSGRRALVAALAVVAVGLLVLEWPSTRPDAMAPERDGPRRTERAPRPLPSFAAPPVPSRNPFQYADGAAAPPPTVPVGVPSAPQKAAPVPPAAGPKALGLVRRAGTVRVLLWVGGQTALVSPGEELSGVKVLAIEADRVRIQAADGTVLELEVGP
jgi:hypothetical protein